MTKSLRFLFMSFAVLLGSTFGAQQCEAGGCEDEMSGDPIEGCFYVSRDAGIQGAEGFFGGPTFITEQLSNAGAAGRIRGLKSNQNVAILDFDTAAIQSYINANPGVASAELFIFPAEGSLFDPTGDVGIQTIESTNDWAEGDAPFSGANLNWTADTSAATYFYASTKKNAGGALDEANSLEWIDPDSGPYTFTSRTPAYTQSGVTNGVGGNGANPTPEFTNSNKFLQTDIVNGLAFGESASVALDSTILSAMLNDVNNRGLRLGENFQAGGVVDNSVSGNWRIFDREQSGIGNTDSTAYIQLTISAGQVGDFDGDLDVDGADFLKWQRDGLSLAELDDWQNNYGAGGGGVSAVPEPSSVALLALSSALLLARRKTRLS